MKMSQKFHLKEKIIILFNILTDLLIIMSINIISSLFLLNRLRKCLILYIYKLHIWVSREHIKRLLYYFTFINSLK